MPMGNTARIYHAQLFWETLDTIMNLMKRLIVQNDRYFLGVGRPRYIYIYICIYIYIGNEICNSLRVTNVLDCACWLSPGLTLLMEMVTNQNSLCKR